MNAGTLMDIVVLGAGSGRVSYSITKDEIFRPMREAIYRHSAPFHDDVLVRDENGDNFRPARMMHEIAKPGQEQPLNDPHWRPEIEYRFEPMLSPREPGFFGQLVECPYCLSFWVAAFAFVAYLLFGDIAVTTAALFGIWAIATSWSVKLL